MSVLGIVALLVGLLSYPVAFDSASARKLTTFLLVYVTHLGAAIAYWQYVLNYGGDAVTYYENPLDLTFELGDTGTKAVIGMVDWLKHSLGASMLDCFLIFQLFGLYGCAFILRISEQLSKSFGARLLHRYQLLLLAPGLHFWTSAIGKDAPLNLGVCLAIWSTAKLPNRLPVFALAASLMFVFRPHIAALTVSMLPICFLFERRANLALRLSMFVFGLAIFAISLPTVMDTMGVQVFDSESLDQFIESRQDFGMRSEQGADLVSLPLPLKIAALLFRPFFFDASGILGLIASIENAVLLAIVGFLFWRFREVAQVAKSAMFVRFCVAYSILLSVILGVVNYNVGLGLRQKMMIVPAILVVLFATITIRRYTQSARART